MNHGYHFERQAKKSHLKEVSMVRKRAMKYQIERMEAQTEASLIDLSNEKKTWLFRVYRGLYYHILPSCVCFCFLGSFVSDKQSCHVGF